MTAERNSFREGIRGCRGTDSRGRSTPGCRRGPAFQHGERAFAVRTRELATFPSAAIVVEDRYSSILKHNRIRPGVAADGIAELQIRWPTVPIVFCETRSLAEEYVYRFFSAATTWAVEESVIEQRLGLALKPAASKNPAQAGAELPGTPTEIRAWVRAAGIPVSDRGRISKGLLAAFEVSRISNET